MASTSRCRSAVDSDARTELAGDDEASEAKPSDGMPLWHVSISSFDLDSSPAVTGNYFFAMAQVAITTDDKSARGSPACHRAQVLSIIFISARIPRPLPVHGCYGRALLHVPAGERRCHADVRIRGQFRKGLIVVALILAIPTILAHMIVFQSRMLPASVFNVILSFAFDVFTWGLFFAAFLRAKSLRRRRSTAQSAFISSLDSPLQGSTLFLPSSNLMPSIWIRRVICILFLWVSILFISALEA